MPSFIIFLAKEITLNLLISKKKIIIEKQNKKNKENFALAPLCSRADLIAIPKSSLLEAM